jgi:hypothetical protein
MQDVLFQYYPVNLATWAYLSSLLTIALFFKFSRLWSLRNLDLIGLILLAPGLLMAEYPKWLGGMDPQTADDLLIRHQGYIWLFVTGGLLMVRLLSDPMLVRRPLLEPNLSVGGMTFLGVALFVFIMANVLTSRVESPRENVENSLAQYGPGYHRLFQIPRVTTRAFLGETEDVDAPKTDLEKAASQQRVNTATVRLMAIVLQLAIVAGILAIGYWHFENHRMGVAAASLYLMLPYTAMKTGDVYHLMPAALLIWALAAYRWPLVAGALIGLAIGVVYYPLFLLPLWLAFYLRRGLVRFGAGVVVMLAILVADLAINSDGFDEFTRLVGQMFGWAVPWQAQTEGFWDPDFVLPVYRIPVLAAFIALAGSLALWPAQKNLGTLMACSGAVMLGTQFWHAHGGGLFMAWYVPLALLTVFRPNLEDRVALSVLGEGWRPKWRYLLPRGSKAA